MGLFPREFVVVDIETTGLDPFKDKIVEIYALKVWDWEPIDEFYSMCYTESIPEDAISVHGIRPEATWDWPKEELVMKRFFKWLGDLLYVGHNVDFERSFFARRYRLLFGKEFNNFHLCTLDLFGIYKHPRKIRCSYALWAALSHFNIPHGKLHRAKEDAWATFRLLKVLLSFEDVREWAEYRLENQLEWIEYLRRKELEKTEEPEETKEPEEAPNEDSSELETKEAPDAVKARGFDFDDELPF